MAPSLATVSFPFMSPESLRGGRLPGSSGGWLTTGWSFVFVQPSSVAITLLVATPPAQPYLPAQLRCLSLN